MSEQDNGGPAFPAHDYIVGNLEKDGFQKLGNTRGMTLRDYFAAKAMASIIIANPMYKTPQKNVGNTPEYISMEAYKFADAMIAERNKP